MEHSRFLALRFLARGVKYISVSLYFGLTACFSDHISDFFGKSGCAVSLAKTPIPVALGNSGGVHSTLDVGKLEIVLHGYNYEIAAASHGKLNEVVCTALTLDTGALARKAAFSITREIFAPASDTVRIV